jgi:hypothetical protein
VEDLTGGEMDDMTKQPFWIRWPACTRRRDARRRCVRWFGFEPQCSSYRRTLACCFAKLFASPAWAVLAMAATGHRLGLRMLRGPMQCAAILDDIGIGKTVSICAMICELASERTRAIESYDERLAMTTDAETASLGPKPTHRPVAVVAPQSALTALFAFHGQGGREYSTRRTT